MAGVRAGEKIRRLAGRPSSDGRRGGEISVSVTLTLVSSVQSPARPTSPPIWPVLSTSLPTWPVLATSRSTWPVVSPSRGFARRSEPAHLEPARRAGAARLPGGARVPRGPTTRRLRRMRQSLRAPPPTRRGGAPARGSTQPCRFPKRARRGGHLHPSWPPRGRPALPARSVRAAQPRPARGPAPQPAGTRSVPAARVDARPSVPFRPLGFMVPRAGLP